MWERILVKNLFPPDCFDGVVVADVLEHLYDLPTAVEQIGRVLRPGGVLVFDTINRTYASYVLAIAIAQEGLRVVPPATHDWRLFIKPDELTILLQSHGFLADTSSMRGLAPTFALRDPLAGAKAFVDALRDGDAPPLPIADFMEVSSLEVQYMGWARKPH